MKPTQALKKDWRMYYNRTWMMHKVHGPGPVRVIDGILLYGTHMIPVAPKDLDVWWPRSGSHNTETSAVYIERQAVRNMRKSAVSGSHYILAWGHVHYGFDIMSTLAHPTPYCGVNEALQMLKDGDYNARAVTRDIILHTENEKCEVLFKGKPVGTLDIDHGFDGYIPQDPLCKRAFLKLYAEDTAWLA